MALTATAIPALPSWDETIVPALRKRLESESRTLSKRMSAVSVTSAEDYSDSALRDRNRNPSYSGQSQRSATTPRPNLQQPRPSLQGLGRPTMHKAQTSDASDLSRAVAPSSRQANGTRPAGYRRTRSTSQPFTVDNSVLAKAKVIANGNGNGGSIRNGKPSLESGRSISPHNTRSPEVKPTRIPKVARGDRSGSVSSHGHTPPVPWSPSMGNGLGPSTPLTTTTGNAFGSHSPPTLPESSQDLWSVDDSSNMTRPSRRQAGPVHEATAPAPMSQQSHGSEDSAPPRPSVESEERPFEHWYRGEVSRNGGVGELRVGKRMEMLEIANYGHTLRKATIPKNQTQVPTYTNALVDSTRRRKRADSLSGMSTRESFLMDDDEKAGVNGVGGYLVDESPLTDLDGSIDDHEVANGYTHGKYGFPSSTPSSLRNGSESEMETKSATPTTSSNSRVLPSKQGSIPASRIPGPSQIPRQSSEPSRAAESTPMSRGASEPPSLPSAAAGPSTRRPQQSPLSQSQRLPRSASQPSTTPSQLQPPQTPKRRAKSPAASSSSSASKKAKVNKNLARIRDEKNRRSVAEYPSPPSGDEANLMDAIPSWTQPVYGDEDWDEVVIPVVARKKGLDTRYETAGGGPKLTKKNDVPAPAPGTFAYDHSKYRPPRDDEDIPMDEFGRVDEESENPGQQTFKGTLHDERPIQPAPFSHYASHEVRGKEERIQEIVAVVDLDRQGRNRRNGKPEKVLEQKDDAGCCQCVIM